MFKHCKKYVVICGYPKSYIFLNNYSQVLSDFLNEVLNLLNIFSTKLQANLWRCLEVGYFCIITRISSV